MKAARNPELSDAGLQELIRALRAVFRNLSNTIAGISSLRKPTHDALIQYMSELDSIRSKVRHLEEALSGSPHQRNPMLALVTNPGSKPGNVRGVHANPPQGTKFSNDVQAIVYEHVTEGPRVHGFGNADPELKTRGNTLSMTGLKEKTAVCMYAMPDGSVLIKSRDGKRLWMEE